MSFFTFDARSQRYRITDGPGKGQFLGKKTIQNIARSGVSSTLDKAGELHEKLVNDQITLAEWEVEFGQLLKLATIQQYKLGYPQELSQRDYGLLGNMLKFQYQQLRGFVLDIADEKVSLGQFLARASLYTNKTIEAFHKGTEESHSKAGFPEERRVRTKQESCNPCISYESMGWVPIGTTPRPTQDCDCMANCGCYKEFR